MDSYRASDINQSMMNRSYAPQGRVKSNTESVIDYQNSQTFLFKMTLVLSVVLVSACLLLIAHVIFSRAMAQTSDKIDKSDWSVMNRIRYTLFGTIPKKRKLEERKKEADSTEKSDSGFFDHLKDYWPSDKVCSHIKELEHKLKSQRFSVQGHIDQLPIYDSIKNNHEKYELAKEFRQPCLDGDIEASRALFNEMSGNLDKIIGSGNLNLKSSQDDFSALNTKLHDEEGRYKEAEKLLNNNFVYSVKGTANDLMNSARNLQQKKIMLNGFRFNLFNQARQLENVIKEIKNAKEALEDEKNKEINLTNKLREAEALVEKFNAVIKEKEGNIDSKQKKELAELRDIKDKIEEAKMFIRNSDKTKAEMKQRQDRVAKSKNILEDIDNKISDVEREMANLQAEHKNKVSQFKSLGDSNEILENKRKIYTIKLDVLLRNKEIKAFLGKLINGNTNIENLSTLMNSKISDEEKLMVITKQYKEESDKMDALEGKTVVDHESVTTDVIEEKIEKDKENFKHIMEKYLGLKKVVDEYEDPDIQINAYKVKVSEIDTISRNNLNDKNKFKQDIDRFEKNINQANIRLNGYNEKKTQVQQTMDQDNAYIKEKQDQLDDATNNLVELKSQASVLEKKYKVD